jgi:hypothetical protein
VISNVSYITARKMERRISLERQKETNLQRIQLFPRQVQDRDQTPEDPPHEVHERTGDELEGWNWL